MIKCAIVEEFVFDDEKKSIVVTDGGHMEVKEIDKYSKFLAAVVLYYYYIDWIHGKEPEGWFDKANKITLYGYFWVNGTAVTKQPIKVKVK